VDYQFDGVFVLTRYEKRESVKEIKIDREREREQ
jgi:hypothetical protein